MLKDTDYEYTQSSKKKKNGHEVFRKLIMVHEEVEIFTPCKFLLPTAQC